MIKHKSYTIIYILSILTILTALSAISLVNSNGGASIRLSNNASAVTSNQSATASVTVGAIACTMSGTIATGNEHTATINPGGYAEDIGTTNLSVICNDPDGFDLYAVGYSGTSSDLTNTAGTIGNTNMVSDNTFTIATGLNTPTSVGDGSSNWAMKLSLVTPYDASTPNILSDTSGSYADYHVVPSTETKVASFNASTGSSISSKINTTYRVYLNTSQPAGTYKGQVKYTIAGHNPNTSFSLYMQDFTPEMCETLGQATEKYLTLYDKRDNIAYKVGYLADGNCWMLDNLSLDLTNVSLSTLQGNTNASNTTLNYLKNGGGTASDQWATAGVSKAWTSSAQNYYSVPMIAVDSTTSGPCDDSTTWCVSSDGTWSSTTVTPATINNKTSNAQGKLGVYYNYCAASAGSYCWGNGTSITGSPSPSSDPDTSTLQDVSEDICPHGWHLPTSTSSGEFHALYTAYSLNYTNFQTALSTPFSGGFYDGKAYNQGRNGYFWSSTWDSSQYMYSMYVNSTSVGPSSNGFRYHGISVRCLVDN